LYNENQIQADASVAEFVKGSMQLIAGSSAPNKITDFDGLNQLKF